jgi:hypothetical protein
MFLLEEMTKPQQVGSARRQIRRARCAQVLAILNNSVETLEFLREEVHPSAEAGATLLEFRCTIFAIDRDQIRKQRSGAWTAQDYFPGLFTNTHAAHVSGFLAVVDETAVVVVNVSPCRLAMSLCEPPKYQQSS